MYLVLTLLVHTNGLCSADDYTKALLKAFVEVSKANNGEGQGEELDEQMGETDEHYEKNL